MTADALHDRYDVGPRLGGGADGEVYRGQDRRTGEAVAIKHFWRPRAGSTALREAAALLGLEHPHVVHCRDFLYLGAGELYLISDFINGGDLRSWLEERGRAGEETALRLTDHLLDGLGALHGRGLLHGDVKPENLLVEETADGPVLRVGDLGSARLRTAGRAGEIPGTPAYQAPERYEGRASEASDLYSVGVILFELLTGRRPFVGDPAALRRAHRRQEPDLKAIISPVLQDFVRRLLDKDPGHRFAGADEARRALAAVRAAMTQGRPAVTRRRTGVTRPPMRAGPGWKRASWVLPERRERMFLLHAGGRPQVAIEQRGVLEIWDALTGRPTGLALPQVGLAVQVPEAGTLVYATPSRVVRWELEQAREVTLLQDVPRLHGVQAESGGTGLLWAEAGRLNLTRPGQAMRSWPCRHFGWGVVARFLGAGRVGFATGPHRPAWLVAGEDGKILAEHTLPGPVVEATTGAGGPVLAVVLAAGEGVETVRWSPGEEWQKVPGSATAAWVAGAASDLALWSLLRGGLLQRRDLNGQVRQWAGAEGSSALLVTPDDRFVAVVEGSGPATRLVIYETELKEPA